MKTVIKVENLYKEFSFWIDRPSTFKAVLVNLVQGKLDLGKTQKHLALKDVSFEIKQGEFVGIMGRNGAGKSTLLKLIAGIYTPTSGSIHVSDSIAPLIELGAGFDPDLSGYENIFLNAAILGFGRKATLQAVPKILEFAELGEKIQMPIRKYSSGMLVRLGFSIASHLTAPIILIDEVLAVGDVGFQEKCIRKIHELHNEGRTIILITHNPEAVRGHCQRCIVIDNREKVFDGSASEGVDIYLKKVLSGSG
jgi:ABC-type polysaccharide/polyol phosphate transport system ATPase subunit